MNVLYVDYNVLHGRVLRFRAFTMRKKKGRLRLDTLIDAHCWIRRMDQKGRFELDEGRKRNERSASSADWPKGRDRGDFT